MEATTRANESALQTLPSEGVAQSGREAVLRTHDLSKRFGRRIAVNDLNIEVRRGDVFGLLGPNGSGKTTTLRMALGLAVPTGGDIELFGVSTRDGANRRAALQRVGAIVEQPAFYPFLSGRENLRGIAVFAGLADAPATRARVDETLEQVGLAVRADDAYRKYSLGMKQRLGIAAALLTRPELVILDEPTNGLDPAGMVEVRGLISQLVQSGITVLLSSHLLYEVQQVCTRVAILQDGVLLAQGEVGELLATQRGVLLGFDDPALLPRAAGALLQAAQTEPTSAWLRGAQYVQPESGAWVPPGGWLLLADTDAQRGAQVTALLAGYGLFPAEVRRREGSLEQFFLSLTNAQGAHAQVNSGQAQAPAFGQSFGPSVGQAGRPAQPAPPTQAGQGGAR